MSAPMTSHIATAVTDHLEAIRRLAHEYGVDRLDVFGDAAEGELDHPRLPVDFYVVYPETYDFGPWFARYIDFQEALAHLLRREVFLTMEGASRRYPHRAKTIEETRRLIYAAA